MNRPGILVYKCRRCGETFNGVHAPDAFVCLIHLMIGIKQPWSGNPVEKDDIHRCNDGNLGIGDIIGAVEDKEN